MGLSIPIRVSQNDKDWIGLLRAMGGKHGVDIPEIYYTSVELRLCYNHAALVGSNLIMEFKL